MLLRCIMWLLGRSCYVYVWENRKVNDEKDNWQTERVINSEQKNSLPQSGGPSIHSVFKSGIRSNEKRLPNVGLSTEQSRSARNSFSLYKSLMPKILVAPGCRKRTFEVTLSLRSFYVTHSMFARKNYVSRDSLSEDAITSFFRDRIS